MTPEAAALLKMIAGRKQGRVSFSLLERDRAMAFAGPLLDAGLIRERRLGFDQGFQISEAGRAYLAGESL